MELFALMGSSHLDSKNRVVYSTILAINITSEFIEIHLRNCHGSVMDGSPDASVDKA